VADKKTRSAVESRGRLDLAAQHGHFVTEHDDLQLLELVRPREQEHELKNPPQRDVPDREDYSASAKR
jgi:hypothetical protein